MSLISYFRLGIDLGSTSVKVALVDADGKLVFSHYQLHQTQVKEVLLQCLNKAEAQLGDVRIIPCFTGSASMEVSEKYKVPFMQEVLALHEAVKNISSEIHTIIDIGGEDSKIIFLQPNAVPDVRMNGNCAGGTGAFIEQMAYLLNVSLPQFDNLASEANQIFLIASRCGVFAKTDVQNLLAQNTALENVAASVYNALCIQVLGTLLRGTPAKKKVLFSGGPLFYLPELGRMLTQHLNFKKDDVILPEHATLQAAIGAALSIKNKNGPVTLSGFMAQFSEEKNVVQEKLFAKPLFESIEEQAAWENRKNQVVVPFVNLENLSDKKCFLGIDSGSTTTKIVITDEADNIAFSYYAPNRGNPFQAVKDGLQQLYDEVWKKKISIYIAKTAVTGYGEALIKTAFNIDEGIVETTAHHRAARKLNSKVSFILDIGGQDMKAIFIDKEQISKIEINEACSSGCGTFIETFAHSLGYNLTEFSELACKSKNPYNLGSRCTVFMNSRVKQCLKEGVPVEDIAAGLAGSVVKNCFSKVLKITDTSIVGDQLVLQGGAFKNKALVKSLEQHLNTEVIKSPIAELMGAYGCALIAREKFFSEMQQPSTFIGLDKIASCKITSVENYRCKGCTNYCNITKTKFSNGKPFFYGNNCINMKGDEEKQTKFLNYFKYKEKLLFDYKNKTKHNIRGIVGIPRILNFYENYPFWIALFDSLNYKVILSSPTTGKHLEQCKTTLMSDNICLPAKIAHSHIEELIRQKPDFIFFPIVRYEEKENEDTVNSYNCPIVTGYPDVVRAAINPEHYGVKMESPVITFSTKRQLIRSCAQFFKHLNIPDNEFLTAFIKALNHYKQVKNALLQYNSHIIEIAEANEEPLIVIGARPYHTDDFINQQIPDIIQGLGAHVVSADAISVGKSYPMQVLSQWEYSNRLYAAATYMSDLKNAAFVQLNSFGCGPDAVVTDEVKRIVEQSGKRYALIRIDEISGTTSVRLRLRALIETQKAHPAPLQVAPSKHNALFQAKDRKKTIIAPNISPFYSLFIENLFGPMGYNFEVLPLANQQSVETGLKYCNNDICYPAIICIGDIIKALQSGRYDLENIVVAISETGGQCRASNYVSLLKKAMLQAGYENIPVVSVSVNPSALNEQPGFKKKLTQMLFLAIDGLLFTDTLMKLYYAAATRERNSGDAEKILNQYLQLAKQYSGNFKIKNLFPLLEQAVEEFNRIPEREITQSPIKIGIVGEIFLKYNPFANHFICDWLIKRGFELHVPSLNTFFLENLHDIHYNNQHHIEYSSTLKRQLIKWMDKWIGRKLKKANAILKMYKHPLPAMTNIHQLAAHAEPVLSLANQSGEGWLLPGEIAMMASEGINHIICLQPFGCIANHVVAKGVANRIKELYPNINLLFLDVDSGSTEVNFRNRLELFVQAIDTANTKSPR